MKKNILSKVPKDFLFIVVLPLFLVIAYYFIFSSNRYVSESILSVKQAGDSSSSTSDLSTLIGVTPSSKEDTLYLKEYLQSMDLLLLLDKEISLRKIYSEQKKDFLYWFGEDSPNEDFLQYYTRMVNIAYDDVSGLLKINVSAFDSNSSNLIAKEILKQSEMFVNELSHLISRQQLSFAEDELKRAENRLLNAKNSLLGFQNKYGMFNPLEQAQAQANLALEFEATLAKKEAELAAMSSYLQNSSPQVVTLKNEIEAIKKQIEKEKSRVATKGLDSTNLLASEYQSLTIEATFAEEVYKLALKSVEQARIESSKKIKYLSIIQKPTLPEIAKYPRILYNIITIFCILLLIFGIYKLIKATIEDHKY
ncbi:MAG: capsule biosynthesis protein [Campylobacteraceae bacterium]